MAELANSQKFKTVTTNMGRNAVALAHATGTSVKVTHIAVGDGSGNPIEPNAAMTELVHEVFRGTVNDVVILEDRPGQFTAELIIPQNTGGFFIREVGLFLEDGTLFAVGSTPLTEKPDLSSGAASDLIIRMIIRILDAGLIEILVDPAQVLVTRDLLERRLKDFVTVKTNQDIEGIKNYKPMRLRIKSSVITAFETPEADSSESFLFVDKNGKIIGSLNIAYLVSGKKLISLIMHKDDETMKTISIGVDEKGEFYTSAPNPPEGDSSQNIATTYWSMKNASKIKGKGVYTDLGIWTIPNLTPGKPLFIINKQDKGTGYSDIKIISGVETGMAGTQTYRLGKDGSNVFVCVPAEETVQIEVIARGGDNGNYNFCRAYQ